MSAVTAHRAPCLSQEAELPWAAAADSPGPGHALRPGAEDQVSGCPLLCETVAVGGGRGREPGRGGGGLLP